MENPEVTFTLAYLVFSICFVFTPNELYAEGLSVQNLLAAWLQTEELNFVQHHMRRTALSLVCHSLIPLGYFIGMCIAASDRQFYNLYEATQGWKIFFVFAILLPVCTSMLALYWSQNRWGNHPLARTLAHHAIPPSEWRAVASSVNTEFRRIDKFATGSPGSRVIVTDTWVMKVTTYYVYIAQQQDIHLTVTNSKNHEISTEPGMPPVQLLTIRVSSINPSVKPFDIRLNSTEYSELREKLHAPIRNAANVVIHQTLSDMFLDTFRSYVEDNEPYHLPSSQELEPCIGCMQINANVKLVKQCREPDEGECQQCYCRPMWCLTCMGKWFASRQDQHHPETWLSSQVPCPTCRAKFCILDVCVVL